MSVPEFEPHPRLDRTMIRAVGFYIRSFTKASIAAVILSLPLLLAIHLISPMAATFGVLGVISFVFIGPFGLLSKSEQFRRAEEALERLKEELSAGELFLFVIGLYAPAFWAVISVSAVFGIAGMAFGYPALAFIGAIITPMIDDEMGNINPYLSPSILVRMVVFELMELFGLIKSDLANEAKRPDMSYPLFSI